MVIVMEAKFIAFFVWVICFFIFCILQATLEWCTDTNKNNVIGSCTQEKKTNATIITVSSVFSCLTSVISSALFIIAAIK